MGRIPVQGPSTSRRMEKGEDYSASLGPDRPEAGPFEDIAGVGNHIRVPIASNH